MNPETFGEICFPGTPESVSQARGKVREWLGRDHPAYESARLAVSELVTNAVRHAGSGPEGGGGPYGGSGTVGGSGAGALVLRLTARGDALRIEVVDPGWSTGEPRVLRADPTREPVESGRGLAIVSALSGGNWGYRSHGPGLGRTVWCEIPADPPLSGDLPEELQGDLPGDFLGDLSEKLAGDSPENLTGDLSNTFARPARPAHSVWSEYGGLSTRVWWQPPRPE
ncbi:ATP-binding protein [Streptosporangium sp. NPDC051022]|uniref:ATP-binding protein n=1 Tax=Streptosporangium sp. NPDC051022 TaxID=3155752 RepID=UPI00341E849E